MSPVSATAGRRPLPMQGILAALLFLALLVGVVFVWQRPPRPRAVAYEALLFDASRSVEQGNRCRDAYRIGAEIVSRAKGATVRVTVFATGDARTGNEPGRLGGAALGPRGALLEGRDTEAAVAVFRRELAALCAGVALRNESPVFRAAAAVLAILKQQSCGTDGVFCRLWVRTDLLDPIVERAVRGKGRFHLPKLDNAGIEARFCGLSERRGRGAPLPVADDLLRLLRRSFTNPEAVHVEPSCAAFAADGATR